MEISLETVFRVLRKYAVLIIVFALVGAIGAYAASVYLIKPVYVSQMQIIVVTGTVEEKTSASQSNTEWVLALRATKTCNTILSSADYSKMIREKAALDHDPEIEFTCDDETTVIKVNVSDNDPQTAYKTATCVAETAGEWLKEKTSESITANISDSPKLPKSPASPNPVRNALLAAVLCAALIFVIELLREVLGTKVKDKRELAKRYADIPVIASIPDFNESVRRSSKYYYYSGYGSKGEK